MGTLLKDLRYAVRMMAKAPAFTLVAVVSLALGIGANTTVFSLLDAALLRTLPVQNPDQIVQIATGLPGGPPHNDFSYPAYVELRDNTDVLSGTIAYADTNFGLSSEGNTERVHGEFVSSNYFSVLGVNPAVGSAFAPDDERAGAARAAVISHALWMKSFGGQSAVLQKTIALNGRTFSIVGVAPREFAGLLRGVPTDVWITVPHMADFDNNPKLLSTATMSWLSLAGRLKPGVPVEQAEASLTVHFRRTFEDAKANENWGALLTRAPGGDSGYVAELSRPLTLLFVAVALILTIACANVASLLVARATSRGKEIGIRLALGATRLRIIRQLLTESFVLAFLGGVLGLLVAIWTAGLASGLQTRAGGTLDLDVSLNLRLLLFAFSVSLITVLLFGVIPAWRASRVDLIPTLKDGVSIVGRSRRLPSLHAMLVVTQVTLALVLLTGAGLFIRSLWKLQRIDKGFAGHNVLATSLSMELQGYDKTRGANFYTQALDHLSTTPGVEAVSLASALPVSASGSRMQLPPNETTPAVNENISIDMISVAPRFFEATSLPLVAGRDFRGSDSPESAKVMIVNETMARKFWPNTDAVGQLFKDGRESFEVVGVARDTKYRNLREAPRMAMYQPLSQSYRPSMNLIVRTSGEPSAIAPFIVGRMREVDPAITVFNTRTLSEHVGRSLYVEKIETWLLGFFAVLALLLTAIGIYGVVAYGVAQRTRELGVRMALGAQKMDVLTLILGQGLSLIIVGAAIGLIGCYWLSRFVESQLYGVSPLDPAALGGSVALLAAVGLLACYIPARRATKVDPLEALRYE